MLGCYDKIGTSAQNIGAIGNAYAIIERRSEYQIDFL